MVFVDHYATSFPALNMLDFVSGNQGFMVLGGAASDRIDATQETWTEMIG